jgi:predicted ester cyclase
MRGTADGLHFALSDLDLVVLNQAAELEQVATRFVIRGRHTGLFEGIAPTYRPVAIEGYVFDRIDTSGRVVETHMLLDLIGVSRQLGTAKATLR